MKLKQWAAALMAIVMASSLSACASEDVKWIATQGDQKIPSGIYLTLMFDSYYDAITEAADQEGDTVMSKQIDGVPVPDWMVTKTDELFQRYLAIEQEFEKQGLKTEPDELAAIKQQVQSEWQYSGEIYQKNGISMESYQAVMENAYKENALFLAKYGKEGTTPVPEADVRKQFESSYYKLMATSESLTGADGNALDEDAKKLLNTKMQDLVTIANNPNSNFQETILQYEKDKATAEGKDPTTLHEHDATSHISFIPVDSTSYPEDFMKALAEMKNGEARVLTANNVVYAIQKMDITATPTDLDSYYNSILYKLKKDEFDASIKALADATQVNYIEKSKKLYVPSKLDFKG